MKHMLEKIADLYDVDAVHRKGFSIRDATPALAAASVTAEIGELLIALALGDRENQLEEMGDVFASVIHLAVMIEGGQPTHPNGKDYNLLRLERRAIAKLNLRFTPNGC